MSKKTLILCLCVVASVVVGLTGTLAFLTDVDTKVNTFVVGNVDIEVEEEFEQNSPLAPGATVDKKAKITNTGANEAWVWMTVAVPADVDPYIELNWLDGYAPDPADGETKTGDDGNEYVVYTIKIPEELAAGESTDELLQSVTLAETVDYQNGEYVAVENGVVTPIGSDLSELDVIVSGYAIQTDGFDTVDEAYDAYGDQWGDDTIPTEETPEKPNGDDDAKTYEVPAGAYRVTSAAELEDAVANGETVILLADGEYKANLNATAGKTLEIYGESKDAVLKPTNEGESGADYDFDGSTVTFTNLTIDTTANNGTYPGYARMVATYNDCVINGEYHLYNNGEFNYCTLDVTGNRYNIWTWGCPTATFDHCTFNCDGKSMLLYGTANTNLTISNSVFNDNDGIDPQKTAIEIGNDYNKSYTLTVSNVDVNGFAENPDGIATGTTLWSNKNSMSSDNLNVVVDGVDVY